MNVLIVGAGARENAIAWKLQSSSIVRKVLIAPGNPGTSKLGQNIPVDSMDFPGLIDVVNEYSVDLTVIGPEQPLAMGLVDHFRAAGHSAIGPTKAAARIECSKVFSKWIMEKYGIPTARAQVFNDFGLANRYVSSCDIPVVIKADGLAAGKGVTVCHTREQAFIAVDECLNGKVFGDAGAQILVEEYLEGQEFSVFAFTDGTNVSPLIAACDYKRLLDYDGGPNTGGMGSFSPPTLWGPEVESIVRNTIINPIVRAMAVEKSAYEGILYAGLIQTPTGIKVIEFNCRFGDPEAQVILPRLSSDLMELFIAIRDGTIADCDVACYDKACVGVVLAGNAYPGQNDYGNSISGLDTVDDDILVFQSGTKLTDQIDTETCELVTNGGRILTLVGLGNSVEVARTKVYKNVGRIGFDGIHYRTDIGC